MLGNTWIYELKRKRMCELGSQSLLSCKGSYPHRCLLLGMEYLPFISQRERERFTS